MFLSLKCSLKWLKTFIHLFLVITGALILVLGVVLVILIRNFPDGEASDFDYIPIVIIIYGCFLTAINICGSFDLKICQLTYMVVMAIISILTLIFAILLFQFTKYEVIAEILTRWFDDENFRINFSAIESSFECCGLTGPSSYPGLLPRSCCLNPDYAAPLICSQAEAYEEGCLDSVFSVFKHASDGLGMVTIIISIFGFVGSGSTLSLFYLKKKR